MNKESVFQQLQKLVSSFERDVQLAKQIKTPNQEDDLAIKASIVGFSYHSPTENWDLGHFDFVKQRLSHDFGPEALSEYGENAGNVKLFFALGIGYLLGLYSAGALTDKDFQIEEMRLSGLLMQHLGELTAHPLI